MDEDEKYNRKLESGLYSLKVMTSFIIYSIFHLIKIKKLEIIKSHANLFSLWTVNCSYFGSSLDIRVSIIIIIIFFEGFLDKTFVDFNYN